MFSLTFKVNEAIQKQFALLHHVIVIIITLLT